MRYIKEWDVREDVYLLMVEEHEDAEWEEIGRFETEKELIQYVNEALTGDFEMVDTDHESVVEYKNGSLDEVVIVHYSDYREDVYRRWMMIEDPVDGDDEAPDCSNCGDGGCYHCEPQRFLDERIRD